MSDSLIRLRQLNQGDLSGFLGRSIIPILSGSGIVLNTGVFPTSSGTENIGSPSFPFNQIYANQLILKSGSGMYFGPTFFNSFISVGFILNSSSVNE